MLRKTILMGVFLIIVINSVNAQTEKELADWHYELAVNAHNNGDCKNASVHVSRAFDLYTRIGDIVGETKCNELILKINNCLGPRGDNQYIQALDSYTKGEDYLNSGDYKKAKEQFDMALLFIYDANSSYQHMLPPDPSRIDKINHQYRQINEEIIECEIMRADDIYAKALDYFGREDPLTARLYVDNASIIYTKYNHSEGIEKCQKLSDRILDVIAKLKERANYLYEKGINAYTGANCTNEGFFAASSYFKQARDVYVLIDDYNGALNCEYILNQTNKKVRDCKETMLEMVSGLIEEANTLLILAKDLDDYDEAEEIANRAKKRYQEIYDIFKDSVSKRKISECEELIRKINAGRENIKEIQNAEGLYDTALKLFAEAEYENASILVKNARGIFEGRGDWSGVTKCDRLIDKIDARLDMMIEAEGYYNKSLEYSKVADYENATVYVEKAREIYMNISRIREVAMCNSTLKDIGEGNKTKNKAKQYYEEALRYLEYREYGTARKDAEEALRLYKKINYPEGIKKAEDLLKRIPVPPQPWTQFIIVPLIILTVLFIIFIWVREKIRKRKKEREAEEKKRMEMEERKRAEIEAEKKKREKEKERMEMERRRIRELLEKERKMVHEERDTIGKTSPVEKKIEEAVLGPEEKEPEETPPETEKTPGIEGKLEGRTRPMEGMIEGRAIESEIEEIPPAEKKIEDRDRLREMIKRDEEAIGREKKAIEGEIEWDRDKLKEVVEKGKEAIGREKKAIEEAVLGPEEMNKKVKEKSKFEMLIEDGVEAISEEEEPEETPPETEKTPGIEGKLEGRARLMEGIGEEDAMIGEKAIGGSSPGEKAKEDRDLLKEMLERHRREKEMMIGKKAIEGEGKEGESSSESD